MGSNVRNYTGFGSAIFTELGRPTEYPAGYSTRPVTRAHIITYEVGHLFGGIHGDTGLMEVTQTRTVGTFTDDSIVFIRKAPNP